MKARDITSSDVRENKQFAEFITWVSLVYSMNKGMDWNGSCSRPLKFPQNQPFPGKLLLRSGPISLSRGFLLFGSTVEFILLYSLPEFPAFARLSTHFVYCANKVYYYYSQCKYMYNFYISYKYIYCQVLSNFCSTATVCVCVCLTFTKVISQYF